MNFRYKGKPNPGANRRADRVEPVCFCTFRGVGKTLGNQINCEIHRTQERYGCNMLGCPCDDYKPSSVKRSPGHWPRCVCGHIAQEHN
jgi:hypothetical protein